MKHIITVCSLTALDEHERPALRRAWLEVYSEEDLRPGHDHFYALFLHDTEAGTYSYIGDDRGEIEDKLLCRDFSWVKEVLQVREDRIAELEAELKRLTDTRLDAVRLTVELRELVNRKLLDIGMKLI